MKVLGERITKGLWGSQPRQRSPESQDIETSAVNDVPVRVGSPGEAVTASEAWRAAGRDPSLLEDRSWVVGTIERLVVDDPLAATNIVIALRDRRYFGRGREVVARILAAHPEYPFALYEAAVIEMRQRRNLAALSWAERAARVIPTNLTVRITHAYLLGATGRPRLGLEELDGIVPQSAEEQERLIYAVQFLEFIDRFDFRQVEGATQRLVRSGPFAEAAEVRRQVLSAVAKRRPFALVRLGDGEGAWTFTGNADEARYANLYRTNRQAFLLDWFGSDAWLTSAEFHAFARALSDVVASCDLVGVGEHRRMFDEYELMGTRGLPGQVNLLRRLRVLDPVGEPWALAPRARLCSAFVNNELVRTGFYPELLNAGSPVGVITSHGGMPDLLQRAGASVEHAFLVPGDTRNPWSDAEGRPVQQWPKTFHDVCEQLGSRDLTGTVFLVAAGFVGKQYLPILKGQGAVALDIGAVADLWTGEGAVS